MGSAAFRQNQVRPVRPTVAVDRGANGPPREPTARLEGDVTHGPVSWAREDLRAQIAQLQKQLVSARAARSAAETRATEAEEEVLALRRKVGELEVEGRLSLSPPSSSCDERSAEPATAKAQEQLIKQLERDLETAKNDLKRVKQKYEQALRKVQSSSAKSQAEAALVVFELRDKKKKLQEENTKLMKEISQIQVEVSHEEKRSSSGLCNHGSSVPSTSRSTNHTQLVLELSKQVSSLSEELKRARGEH